MRKECYGKVSVEGILFVSTATRTAGRWGNSSHMTRPTRGKPESW